MRNKIGGWICGLLLLLSGGCTSGNSPYGDLNEGYAALENHQYDQAISHADSFLRARPTGPGSAEAYYLRGRAYEQKTSANMQQAQENLRLARDAYEQALKASPSLRLEAFIHTSLANVAYFQDDFSSAVVHWTAAYEKLDQPEIKSWVLYRLGLCRQRMGQFAEADRIFTAVQQHYPNTIPAQRARQKQGARSFSVQLATLSSSQAADAAITALRKEGMNAYTQRDVKGRSVVFVGPVPSYQQAREIKQRCIARYPDALIVP